MLPSLRHLVFLSALALVFAPAPASATVADDLCGPLDDPCVLSGEVTIEPGSTIDLGGRGLQLTADAELSWSGDVMVLNAAACNFNGGSRLFESAATPGIPLLWLYCTSLSMAGTITTRGAGILVEGSAQTDGPYVINGTIKAKGDQVGVIAVDAIGGDIIVSGKIQAQSVDSTF